MEAWKTGDPELQDHPIAALSAATLRWALEPFPHNLLAASDLDSWLNVTYYPCGDNLDQLCIDDYPSCQELSCLILIENTGRTNVGPANSDIVGLVHGIVLLLLLLATGITVAYLDSVTMGFLKGLLGGRKQPAPPPKPDPRVSGRGDTTHLRVAERYYRPPLRLEDRPAEIYLSQPEKAKEVVRVTNLLRDMFELDLSVGTMKHSVLEADIRKMEDMKRESNALFTEIRNIVKEWDEHENQACGCWNEEEMAEIEQIRQIVFSFPPNRC